MASFSAYSQNLGLTYLYTTTALSGALAKPSAIYLHLHTGAPGTTGANEVSDANYVPQNIVGQFGAAASRAIANNATINFAAPAGSPGTVTYWSLWSTGTVNTGNFIASGAFTTGKVYDHALVLNAGDLSINVTASTGMSTFDANLVLNFLFGTSGTRPTAWYLALMTAEDGDAGGGTECASDNYARESCTFTVTGNSAATAATSFPTPSGNWGNMAYASVYDASTSGNLHAYGTASGGGSPASGDVVTLAVTATLT